MRRDNGMPERERIRILVVDDHAVVRSGIEYSLLALEDIELVGAVGSGEEALRFCSETLPDVILMDLMMPGLSGAATTRAILQRHPQIRVIALTSYQEGRLVQDALAAGAISYLLKDVGMDELAEAIRAACVGQATLAPKAAQALAESATEPSDLGSDLTDREREVLALIVEGRSNVDIADMPGISLSTARFHVSTILSKLNATNRAEAAALAVKHHLLF
jgi:NarL family two-component system response regulator LiaR